jgi:hypothetical protein
MRSFQQAKADPACLHAEARTVAGVAHTVTLWRDAAAARAYGTTGAHRQAAAVFPKIATGKVWSGPADAAPDWPEARRLWAEHGTPVRGDAPCPTPFPTPAPMPSSPAAPRASAGPSPTR